MEITVWHRKGIQEKIPEYGNCNNLINGRSIYSK